MVFCFTSVADPDLQIRGVGGGGSYKKIFQPLGPHFGPKIRGEHAGGPRAPPLDSPLYCFFRRGGVCRFKVEVGLFELN